VKSDALFREAVACIDAGNLSTLRHHLTTHATLACERLEVPGDWLRAQVGEALDGYFQRPYLLWFVTGNPVRQKRLAPNSALLAAAIIQAASRQCPGTLPDQLDYALSLVSSGRVARESGVQLALMDVLLDAGARPDGALMPALAHCETAAAERLLQRGAVLSLLAAACTGRSNEVTRLLPTASAEERQAAFMGAALYGRAEMIGRLIASGVDLNAYGPPGLHSHMTALHHAVSCGSLESVRTLVEAGADLRARDRLYLGPPLGWALYGKHLEIAAYLREALARQIVAELNAAGFVAGEYAAGAVAIVAKGIDH
jgi:peptide-methionine (S)-S-oxide reductase